MTTAEPTEKARLARSNETANATLKVAEDGNGEIVDDDVQVKVHHMAVIGVRRGEGNKIGPQRRRGKVDVLAVLIKRVKHKETTDDTTGRDIIIAAAAAANASRPCRGVAGGISTGPLLQLLLGPS